MNKPDLDIIQSPAAERMRQMVTEGFYDRSRTALWMFEVIGREYDEMADWARNLKLEANPQTCTWSIGIWEFIYEIESDDTLSLERRRQQILTKKLSQLPINPAHIESTLSKLTNCTIYIAENIAPYMFRVNIINLFDELNYNILKKEVRRIKPSHLSFEIIYKPIIDGKGTIYTGVKIAYQKIKIVVEVKMYGMG